MSILLNLKQQVCYFDSCAQTAPLQKKSTLFCKLGVLPFKQRGKRHLSQTSSSRVVERFLPIKDYLVPSKESTFWMQINIMHSLWLFFSEIENIVEKYPDLAVREISLHIFKNQNKPETKHPPSPKPLIPLWRQQHPLKLPKPETSRDWKCAYAMHIFAVCFTDVIRSVLSIT